MSEHSEHSEEEKHEEEDVKEEEEEDDESSDYSTECSEDGLECPEDMDMSILPIGIYMHYQERRKTENTKDPDVLIQDVKELVILMFSCFSLDDHDKPFMLEDDVPVDDFVERSLSQLKENIVLGQIAIPDEFASYMQVAEGLVDNYRSGMMEDRHNKLSELFKKHGIHGMFKQLTSLEAQEEEEGLESKCIVCIERDMVAFPGSCAHVVVCLECAQLLDSCPTCREPRY